MASLEESEPLGEGECQTTRTQEGQDREKEGIGEYEETSRCLYPGPESCHAARATHQQNHKMVQFQVKTDQSDGPTLTYSTLFAVRSWAHREYCL